MTPSDALIEEYRLTEAQIQSYLRDGHVLLPGVLSVEALAPYTRRIRAAVQKHAQHQPSLEERDTYGKAFLQVMNLWTEDALIRELVFSKRLAGIAARLAGATSMNLYHDQALCKEGGGGATPWHQDQYYWPLATKQSLTLWMPLVDISVAMGPMRFVSASHELGQLVNMPISDASESHFNDLISGRGLKIYEGQAMKAGDVTFHNGWTLHGARANNSNHLREVMTIIYFPAETRVSEPSGTDQQLDLDTFLPGKSPGDLASGDLTPRVF